MGSHRVGHNWSDLAALISCFLIVFRTIFLDFCRKLIYCYINKFCSWTQFLSVCGQGGGWGAFPNQWAILRCQQGVQEVNSFLALSNWRLNQIPLEKSSVPPYPPPLQMSVLGPTGYLCSWPIGDKSKVPITPSLGFISLLEWLTGFKKVHSLSQSLIYYKGY